MVCDKCHEKEAVIGCVAIINGVKKEIHLCKDCAANHPLFTGKGQSMDQFAGISNILEGILKQFQPSQNKSEKMTEALGEHELKKTNLYCKSCKCTYNEFKKYGKLGCPDCYQTFAVLLEQDIQSMHGSHLYISQADKGVDSNA